MRFWPLTIHLTFVTQHREGQLVGRLAGAVVLRQLPADGHQVGAVRLPQQRQAVREVPQRQAAQCAPGPAGLEQKSSDAAASDRKQTGAARLTSSQTSR